MKTKVTLLLALLTLSLTGCSSTKVSPYDPYATWEGETQNVYAGDKQDFHLEGFYPSDYGQIETPVLKEDGSYFVEYTKQVNYEYTNLFTTVKGRFADFTYINIKAKGTPGKGIAFRLYCGEEEDENHNVLGSDVSFSLNEEYSIHSLKFRGTLKTRADLLKKVCIFPEIGNAGSASSFSYTDIWFSSTLPADSTLENPGVDSGDTSVTVNGWSTDAWTQYTLYNSSSNTGVSYSKPGEWAFIQKDIEIKEEDNGLFFTFENLLGNNDEPSVTVIHFLLKGDVSGHVSEGVEYEYDVYYEGAIYTYDLTKDDEVQPDENGLTTLEVSLESAIEAIGEHHENGYRLALLIESNPEDVSKYKRYRGGEMIIHEDYAYKGEFEVDPYSQFGSSVYTLTDVDGVDKNITYTDLSGSSYWPRVCRRVNTTHDQQIEITFKNNGTNDVLIGIHAGVFADDRSDTANNGFYPLWSANQGHKNGDGYYTDGQDLVVEAGRTNSIIISVDSDDMYKDDVIDVIELLIDSSYGDSVKRSGNIDIISVVITDK